MKFNNKLVVLLIILILTLTFLTGCSLDPEENSNKVLNLGLMIHLEGWVDEETNEDSFRSHAEAVRYFADTLEKYNLTGTFEARPEFVVACDKWDDNVLLELHERGHAIGVHADLGGISGLDENYYDRFVTQLTEYKKDMEDLTGIEIRHVSGICSELDWVSAAIESGYEFTTGGVAYCAMSLLEENQLEEFNECASAGACHDTFPTGLEDRMQPWRVFSGEDWLTPNYNGELVFFPSDAVLYSLTEENEGQLPEGALGTFYDDDVDNFFVRLDEGIELVKDDEYNTMYFAWSIGDAARVKNNDDLYEKLFGGLHQYMESGQVEWKTIPEMYDDFLWWEENGFYNITNSEIELTSNENSEGEITNEYVYDTDLEEGQNYVMFTLNVHDWVFPEKSVEVINKTIDIHEQYEIPVDIYLNDPTLQYYLDNAPELIERLKTSEYVVVGYHYRPPHPAYTGFDTLGLMGMGDEERYETLLPYEEHKLNLETGGYIEDEDGGYQLLKDTMGYAPVAVGNLAGGPIGSTLDQIYFEMGAQLVVVHYDFTELGDKRNGVYVRPEQVAIKLYEANLGYMHDDQSPEQLIVDGLAEYNEEYGNTGLFVNLKMHENNYYTEGTSFWPVYWIDNDKSEVLSSPYDINASYDIIDLRPEAYTASMWQLYEDAVSYVKDNSDLIAVDTSDIVEMLK